MPSMRLRRETETADCELHERIDAAISRGVKFDKFIAAAQHAQYGESAKWMLSTDPYMGSRAFVELVRRSGWYPDERLPKLIAMVNDLKLQKYLLVEQITWSSTLYLGALNSGKPASSPDMQLRAAALDQALIGMGRIFLERLMNLIYYLETGVQLAGRSKKGKFFKFARQSPRWRWLVGWEAVIDKYDELYRTPEFHSGSTLRKHVESGDERAYWQVVSPVNLGHGLWTELEVVLAGGEPNPTNVAKRVLPTGWYDEGEAAEEPSKARVAAERPAE